MPDSQTLFIAIGVTGFLILLLSLVLGEIGGHDGDFGHGGDLDHSGDLGHGVSVEPGADEVGTVPEGSADLDAPTWFSIRVLAVSLVGFGAAGYVAAFSGVPGLLSWPLAGAGFLAVGAATHRFILKPLARQQYNSMSSRYGFVGRTGVVTLDILPHGTGQVTFNDRAGARITQTASSDHGEGVPKGTPVTIVDLKDGGVVVHRSAFSD
ncbi:NfeD family protein [Kineosporia succinea]|uniref:Membrane protein implicated in regulation of membrane protease activity n=1 Tax=Kineosporia succinea TaxID=84632 RepID=A0ABT9NWX7_9ACTN|nr:NfeD family protein [Kineosporia succinea]MDP9824929.1 membrane protein implicated in regulation of membrane protease activity [Kineosporia succinea]